MTQLHEWRAVLKRLAGLLAVLVLVGLLSGHLLPVLLIGLSLYLLHALYHLVLLYRWLHQVGALGDAVAPPESHGIWGSIFDDIYKIRRREAESRQHLENIIDRARQSTAALGIGIVMINQKGNLEWWNPAAETLLGLKAPGDQGQAAVNLIREPRFIDYFQDEVYDYPLQQSSPVNPALMLEYQITRFGEGDRLMLVRDVTQVQKLERMRKDFVGNVSHELRTPITVLSGYLESMLDQQDAFPPRWHKPLQQMKQQSERLENIIRDLLTLSGLETLPVSREQSVINLHSLLSEIRNDAARVFKDKEHRYELNGSECILLTGNTNELYSAFSNLVSNAAKYTPQGGSIVLSARMDADQLIVEVQDNGMGIEEQHLPRLTERFYRVDASRHADSGGTGLGLAIVKHTLARHGATLSIESTPGKGSRFICRFPANRVSADQPALQDPAV